MKNIYEYFENNTREQRMSHLNLLDDCIEIGGNSVKYQGLLAYFLNTTIPERGGKKIMVCHACNNPKCSNPKHLYWGSTSDNVLDSQKIGTWKSAYKRTVEKYGEIEAKEIYKKNGFKKGNSCSVGNNKNKTEEHKKKISESIKNWHRIKNKAPMA